MQVEDDLDMGDYSDDLDLGDYSDDLDMGDCSDDVDLGDCSEDCDYIDNDDDDDFGYEDACVETDKNIGACSKSKKPYKILLESELRKSQENQISKVSSTYLISQAEACKLLYHYKWNSSKLNDEWFTDEAKVRSEVGLPSTSSVLFLDGKDELALCKICFESFPLNDFNFYPSDCGHHYCVTCWNGYITTSINDGPGCLSLRCPDPSCNASICQDMVDKLVGPDERDKYNRFFLRSFIERNKKAIKWCPAPGCLNAIEFEVGDDVYDVTCACKHTFCWNCTEEAHRPVNCDTVYSWLLKNSSESENTNWILANSKPCPKCNRAIEKNEGCMHMTCREPCGYHFCWLCLGDWKDHGEKTGGFYTCNKFDDQKINGEYDEVERRRRLAKRDIEKYTHYYERWANNDKSRQIAINDLEYMETSYIEKLGITLGLPETYLDFILETWEQIIECRRVLKWTYAYGYYIPPENRTIRTFFEYLQGESETWLERLQECAEKELFSFCVRDVQPTYHAVPLRKAEEKLKEEPKQLSQEEIKERSERTKQFEEFTTKLVNLTKVTSSYFEKLVREIESDFSGTDIIRGCSSEELIDELGDDDNDSNESGFWVCGLCTFANPDTVEECQMCSVGVHPGLQLH